MSDFFAKAVDIGRSKYPNIVSQSLEYGTSGFRSKADVLPHIMYRMGLLAVLRSKALKDIRLYPLSFKKGATIGVMVTASHNPEEDNGVKLCDPMGNMITPEWEALAVELGNAKDDCLMQCLQDIHTKEAIDLAVSASVFLGADTRLSSPMLSSAVSDGVRALGGQLNDYGLLTTPQLHFMVCCKNTKGAYGDPTREGYYKKLSTAFLKLQSANEHTRYVSQLHVDGANGVGAHSLKELVPYLEGKLQINIFNSGRTNLNYKCGADYVKIQQTVPDGTDIIPNQRYASVDGDADRLIYFYLDSNKTFHMLDGNKVAALIAGHLKRLVNESGLDLQIRQVQTAYANGSATNYMENALGIPVICVHTGVKNLHHEASKYDIGIYCEANGHVSVLFKENAKTKIKVKASDEGSSQDQRNAADKLLHLIDLINETVGDAISCLLAVEVVLQNMDWNVLDWDQLYSELSYRQLKLKVPDKRMVEIANANCVCSRPEGLQESIDKSVSKYKLGRAFVRPSGTEDIVRVYTEADTQENADSLAKEVAELVKKYTEKH